MPEMNPQATEALQRELTPGESLYWTGQPNPSVVFHKEDAALIPFSLLWGGFAIFWEAGVTGVFAFGNSTSHNPVSWFMALWGIPFVLIGQYLIWGRFFYARWQKRRTYYGLTNRRVIVAQDGRSRQMNSAFLNSLPMINKESRSDGIGTLTFGQLSPVVSNSRRSNFSGWNSMNITGTPTFVDIDDAEGVYRLVNDLRDKASSGRDSSSNDPFL